MNAYKKEETLLSVQDLSLKYDNKIILRDISFDIANITRPGMKQGQVISLIGRSGIGKTQLFRILSGLQQPSAGEVLLNGTEPVKPGDMGVIFQHYYLFEWRTIYRSLLLAAKKNPALRGKEKSAIEAYATDFDLSDHLQKYPAQLSGGQRQRVSIIQQLLNGSNFLLLDEPFSGLDVIVLDKVVDLLLKVSRSHDHQTLIIVSHDIASSLAISDSVFILGEEIGKPGATIVKTFDLLEMNLAWHSNIHEQKGFKDLLLEVKASL